MIRGLNLQAVAEAMPRAGLSAANIAERIGVSREAVSKWLHGKSIPQPDKLLRLGVLLNLTFDELVERTIPQAVPIVSYRRKAARKTRDEHMETARETGELLKRLVPYLPEPLLSLAPVLKEPRCDYEYVQTVASQVRAEMGLADKAVLQANDLVRKFANLHAVIVPVFWGEQHHHGNALNIHLPDSGTTWVFLNLDSNIVDFKFWMAHELGHALAPTLDGDDGEDFADAFAQALLFPEADAVALRSKLNEMPTVSARVAALRKLGGERRISPFTVRCSIQALEAAKALDEVALGDEGRFMKMVKEFGTHHPTVTRNLYCGKRPNPAEYARSGRSFGSPFFAALAAFCKAEDNAAAFIHRVLGLPLVDARGLERELRQ